MEAEGGGDDGKRGEEAELKWTSITAAGSEQIRAERVENTSETVCFIYYILWNHVSFFLNSFDLLSFLTLVILFIYYLSKSVFLF